MKPFEERRRVLARRATRDWRRVVRPPRGCRDLVVGDDYRYAAAPKITDCGERPRPGRVGEQDRCACPGASVCRFGAIHRDFDTTARRYLINGFSRQWLAGRAVWLLCRGSAWRPSLKPGDFVMRH